MAWASEVSKINIGLYLHKCLWEDFLPIHYLFKGKIAHIVTGSLTIYSVVHFSLGIILQTVQPYHHYSTCQITDREHDLKKKKIAVVPRAGNRQYLFLHLTFNINKHLRAVSSAGDSVRLSPREQSDDASAQVCGEWAIYDETVTPTLLNRPPLLRRDMLLLHSFKSVAFLMTILVPFGGVVNRGWNFQVRLMSSFMGIACWGI